jgi:hypothetical protein
MTAQVQVGLDCCHEHKQHTSLRKMDSPAVVARHMSCIHVRNNTTVNCGCNCSCFMPQMHGHIHCAISGWQQYASG